MDNNQTDEILPPEETEHTPGPAPEAKSRLVRLIPTLLVAGIILLIIGLGFLVKAKAAHVAAEKNSALKQSRPPVNVVILNTVSGQIRDRINLPAVIEPWQELKVMPEVAGRIVKTYAQEGSRLNKGDAIAKIDSRDYENAVAAAKAAFMLAQSNLERMRSLYKTSMVSKENLDQAQASVGSLGAALSTAELNLERTIIRTPIAGILNRLIAREGVSMNPMLSPEPAAVVLDLDRLKVSVGIPEADVDEVRNIGEITITIDALQGREFIAKKHFLSKNPDSLAHLYRLELELPNHSGTVLPGMFARAEIVKRSVREGVAVPIYAVVTREDKKFLFVEDGGRARIRQVETGILDGWQVQITNGIEAGARVVIVGQREIDEGQDIKVIRTVNDPSDLLK